MKNRDSLIYDLIFSSESQFQIDIGEYIKDIYRYDEFIDEIKQILYRSKVSIVSQSVDVDSTTVTWKIKVNK